MYLSWPVGFAGAIGIRRVISVPVHARLRAVGHGNGCARLFLLLNTSGVTLAERVCACARSVHLHCSVSVHWNCSGTGTELRTLKFRACSVMGDRYDKIARLAPLVFTSALRQHRRATSDGRSARAPQKSVGVVGALPGTASTGGPSGG